ncbi:hypothetical protein [Hoeflea sp. TYP-13]|uniref:hypothetical protein n=1 Tax=Hoeflea sp. TYP-13 TaxID=3230023 RepID=UPI0034C671D0
MHRRYFGRKREWKPDNLQSELMKVGVPPYLSGSQVVHTMCRANRIVAKAIGMPWVQLKKEADIEPHEAKNGAR